VHRGGKVLVSELRSTVADDDIAIGEGVEIIIDYFGRASPLPRLQLRRSPYAHPMLPSYLYVLFPFCARGTR
jgi:hypothetical protein